MATKTIIYQSPRIPWLVATNTIAIQGSLKQTLDLGGYSIGLMVRAGHVLPKTHFNEHSQQTININPDDGNGVTHPQYLTQGQGDCPYSVVPS